MSLAIRSERAEPGIVLLPAGHPGDRDEHLPRDLVSVAHKYPFCERRGPRPRRRRALGPESENGAGPNRDDTRALFGNSTERLTRAPSPGERCRAALTPPGLLGAGDWLRLAPGDWLRLAPGDWLRLAPAPPGLAGPAGRIFPNEGAPFLHARVRSAPRGGQDWLRSAPVDWLRSAPAIGFARRRGIGPTPPGDRGRPRPRNRQGHPGGSRLRPPPLIAGGLEVILKDFGTGRIGPSIRDSSR